MIDYDAYLFDWDGTLLQSIDIWTSEIRRCYSQYKIARTDKEIGKVLGDWDETLRPLPDEYKEAFKKQLLLRAYNRYPQAPLFDSAFATLEQLKNNKKKLALITTSHRDAIEKMLLQHGLNDYFDTIITGDDVKVHKPDPEGILSALEHLGVAKEKAVMLGDTDKDLGAAKNAGIDSILFYPKIHQQFYERQEFEAFEPAFVLESWNELASLLSSDTI